MSYLITIPNALHVCPQCEQDVAQGFHSVTGKPRICSLCVVENIREQEKQREMNLANPPQPSLRLQVLSLVIAFGFFAGVGFVAGFMVGRLWPQ